MTVLLITYDLNKKGQDYEGVLEQIRTYDWAKLSKSSYVIDTDESPNTVYTNLKPHLDSNDSLCIVEVTKSRKVFAIKSTLEWLKNHLD